MEKAIAIAGNGSGLAETSSQLALGAQLTGDYEQLINFEVIREGVEDELAKLGKWQKKVYKVSAGETRNSRIMRINIDSDNPMYCQEVANIFAKQFIAKIQELIGIQNTQIIEEPALQLDPISPNIKRNTAGGFAVGFMLCFLGFIASSVLDRTIKTPEDVENSLQLPVVGTVHKDATYNLKEGNQLLFSGNENSNNSREKIVEDFRVFRVNLINRKPEDKKDGSVIAVTSSSAKEGKTFCTANLGAALAEAGYRVLLIDCDNTGKRGLQTYFGKKNDTGLMDVLSEKINFEEAVQRNMNNLNMDVLFCGDQKVNSANMMVSPKFKELVKKLKQQYDYAFLDVSCHLGTADIVSAGSTADSVLLLVKAGETEGDAVKQTVESLQRAKLNVSGIILNGVDEV